MKKILLALVLCCFPLDSAFAAFNDLGDGTVWDDTTGLMWQQAHATTASGGFKFRWGGGTEATGLCDGTANQEEDALCYCDSLGLATYTDWRMPDRNEFHSITDYANPHTLATPFLAGTAANWWFWTSTSNDNDPSSAWAFGPIGRGDLIATNPKTNTPHVRCVRGRVFQVSVSAGANLTVSDATLGVNWVDYDGDQDVTYTADAGFSITDVTVDGSSIGAQANPYTHSFTNVESNHTINATTALNTYDIAVTVGNNGTVTDVNSTVVISPPGGTVTVDHGLTQTFEVTPATHYHFDQVQYDSVDVMLDGNNQYTTAAITEAGHTFSATFAEDDKFALTVTTDGTGSGSVTSDDGIIDCPDNTCLHEYYFDHPTQIVLTATAATGSEFDSWAGDCTVNPLVATECTVGDMSQARNVTATFTDTTPLKKSLTVTVDGTGTGNVTSNPAGIDCPGGNCTAEYDIDTEVVLTAVTTGDSLFFGWSGGGCSGSNATCTVVMSEARDVTATFNTPKPGKYALKVTVDGTGNGNVTSDPAGINCPSGNCTVEYDPDVQVVLTTFVAGDSIFTGWSGDCTGTDVTCTVVMDQVRDVTATFDYPETMTLMQMIQGVLGSLGAK